MPGTASKTVVAVGPSGSDLSTDGGTTWQPLPETGFHAVGFAGLIDAGWAVGDSGLVARCRGKFAAR
jgi:photosystem II stability/assembly factor-like uncharacterized protein